MHTLDSGLQRAHTLLTINACLLAIFGLLVIGVEVFMHFVGGLGVVWLIPLVPIPFIIGFANILGFASAINVGLRCRAYGVAARLLAVSVVPFGMMLYWWNRPVG